MKLHEAEGFESFLKKSGMVSLVVSLGIGFIGCSSSSADSASENEEIRIVEELKSDTDLSEQNEMPKEEEPSDDTEIENEKKAEPEEKAETGSVPREYKAALGKAETYSKMMHMSRQGIYDQLVSEYGEQFTPEEAEYAIAHLND